MSEPNEFPPPPFTPAPLELSERSGCRKALLFGCGGLFLLLLLGLAGVAVKKTEIMRGVLGYLEQDCTAKLAPDVPAADRERLHRAFEAARVDPLKNPTALQGFQTKLMELSGKTQLSRQDADGLSTVLEKMGGIEPPSLPAPGPAAPVPSAPETSAPPAPDSAPSGAQPVSLRPTST
ncbi:MAG TPA: hypothetical protein VGS22_06085 [Thermoanaerobaculia bacterium]|jgi:hypothetical protein|nr:hypothetical protein [Thermoanaerobaculia bacterium]